MNLCVNQSIGNGGNTFLSNKLAKMKMVVEIDILRPCAGSIKNQLGL